MEDKPSEQPGAEGVSVSADVETSSVSFEDGADPKALGSDDGFGVELDQDGQAIEAPEGDEQPDAGDGEEPGDPDDGDDTPGEDGEEPDGEEPEELPEWDGSDDDTVAAYEERYITEDAEGAPVINFEAFNTEFEKSGFKDINPGSRKFLKEQFGISDEMIDTHISGVNAQRKVFEQTFYGQFGDTVEAGKEAFDTMYSWAKENYSKEQQEAYNAAAKQGGQAAQDQIELLKNRFAKANPKAQDDQQPQKRKIGIRRPSSPKKSAATNTSTGGKAVTPFANREEHRVAQNAALAEPDPKKREAAIASVRARLKASPELWR